ncbi:MAG: histidinol dehydrogenase [Nitrospirae bacterium]|nr:MAG: histidinol dehydrogenase [Nitrospirota bacterium]
MKIVSHHDPLFQSTLQAVCARSQQQTHQVERTVKAILDAVRRDGDAAVTRYTKKFDGIRLTPDQFRVSPEAIHHAYAAIQPGEREALQYAANRIRAFHERQRRETWIYQEDGGVQLGQLITPLETVGLYVPGGKALYPSTVLMNAIPAKVAGVKRVVMCTPTPTGQINPYLLVAADLAHVDEIYRVGGVQAIGAMAFGTPTIPRTDKIVGPGNLYVAAAKRVVYGSVDIDMIAGPSELLVIADERADPRHVAADLLCEAEHDEEARVYLVTPSRTLAQAVQRELARQLRRLTRRRIASVAMMRHAVAFVVSNLAAAIHLANAIAPEHLALLVDRPLKYLAAIRHAGAVFLGRYTPPAVADYVAGPNHVLPTGGSARFFSALSVDDFVKRTNLIAYTRKTLREASPFVIRLANMEGLQAHAHSLESRLG